MPFSGELAVGMRVEWDGKRGSVYAVHDGGMAATIKWDDGTPGTGIPIKEKPYYGSRGWIVNKGLDGNWGGNGPDGTLKIISKHAPDYKIKAHISRTKKRIDLEHYLIARGGIHARTKSR